MCSRNVHTLCPSVVVWPFAANISASLKRYECYWWFQVFVYASDWSVPRVIGVGVRVIGVDVRVIGPVALNEFIAASRKIEPHLG